MVRRAALWALLLLGCGPTPFQLGTPSESLAEPLLVPQVGPGALRLTELALAPDGRRALLGDANGLVVLLDVERHVVLRWFRWHRERVVGLHIDAEGRGYSVAADGTLCHYAIAEAHRIRCDRYDGVLGEAAFDAAGHLLGVTDGLGLWTLADGALKADWGGPAARIAIHPQGREMVGLELRPKGAGQMVRWRTQAVTPREHQRLFTTASHVAYTLEGDLIGVGRYGFFNFSRTGKRVNAWPPPRKPTEFLIAAGPKRILTGEEGRLRLIDVEQGSLAGELTFSGRPTVAAASTRGGGALRHRDCAGPPDLVVMGPG